MGRWYFVALFICVNSFVAAKVVPRGVQSFVDHEIVPDMLSEAPAEYLSVTFPSGVQALEGNELTVTEVNAVPTLEWNYQPDRFYTLIFCDPDAPSRVDHERRSYLHWLVVNIPGSDVDAGQTLNSFVSSSPWPGTGLHRYVFLVYEQPGVIEFEEGPDDSADRRVQFWPDVFANKYNLGTPLAGNFYQTKNLED